MTSTFEQKLVALHGHWVIADTIKQFVSARLPGRSSSDPFDEVDMHSMFMRMRVWYSLLHVVVEGYQALGRSDPTIDELLTQTDMVDGLRRFRNATFHYQEAMLGDKLMAFMTTPDSEKWIRKLDVAIKAFFENTSPTKEVFAASLAQIAQQRS